MQPMILKKTIISVSHSRFLTYIFDYSYALTPITKFTAVCGKCKLLEQTHRYTSILVFTIVN